MMSIEFKKKLFIYSCFIIDIFSVLGMEANVAGATIMAGGASCPQLATSVICECLE